LGSLQIDITYPPHQISLCPLLNTSSINDMRGQIHQNHSKIWIEDHFDRLQIIEKFDSMPLL